MGWHVLEVSMAGNGLRLWVCICVKKFEIPRASINERGCWICLDGKEKESVDMRLVLSANIKRENKKTGSKNSTIKYIYIHKYNK